MFTRKNFLIAGGVSVFISLLLFVLGFSFWYVTFILSVVLFYISGEVE